MSNYESRKETRKRIRSRRRWARMARRERVVRRSRIPVILMALCAVVGVGGFIYAQDGKSADTPVVAGAHAAEQLVTKTVVVRSGDTVWGIAERCNDGSRDTRELVAKICAYNDVKPGELQIGQVLIVPMNEV